jgi:hypothetical protein
MADEPGLEGSQIGGDSANTKAIEGEQQEQEQDLADHEAEEACVAAPAPPTPPPPPPQPKRRQPLAHKSMTTPTSDARLALQVRNH